MSTFALLLQLAILALPNRFYSTIHTVRKGPRPLKIPGATDVVAKQSVMDLVVHVASLTNFSEAQGLETNATVLVLYRYNAHQFLCHTRVND